MKQLDYFKNGGLSFVNLIATCGNVSDFAERDLTHLISCGVTMEKITELRTKAYQLTDDNSNVILQAQKKMKTKNRDNSLYYFVDKLDIVKKQFAKVFNVEDSVYDNMFRKPHSDMNVKEFLNHTNDILKVLKENKEALVAYNFVESDITAFENDITNLTQLEKEREQAEISFNNDTFARSEARKITYDLLYYIASMGKVYWKRKNPAKSQDYNISRKKTKKKTSGEGVTTSEDVNMEVVNTQSTENTITETPTYTGGENTGNPVVE